MDEPTYQCHERYRDCGGDVHPALLVPRASGGGDSSVLLLCASHGGGVRDAFELSDFHIAAVIAAAVPGASVDAIC
jgi:hypothetical protein